jgi:vacuolar-type H+-ATPase subunit H
MRPVDEILERILGIESEARAVVSEAQELATLLEAQAREEAEARRAHAREQAEQEADALREQVQKEVEKERAEILSEAEGEPQPVETMDHFEDAVDYIVEVVSGQREDGA